MKYKVAIGFLFIMIFFSCNIYRRVDLAGNYSCNPSRLSSSNLILKKDSSFEYEYDAGDWYKETSNGIWRISGDHRHLILNSRLQSDTDLLKVIEQTIASLNKISICVYDDKNNVLPAYIKINPRITNNNKATLIFSSADIIAGCRGFPMQKVKIIAVTYVGINTKNKILYYKVKNANSNKFTIHIKMEPNLYRYFTDAKWRIKKNKLYDLDANYNKNCKVYYKQ